MRQDIASLQDRIKNAQAVLNNLKNAQPASGDSWVVYRSTTGVGVWDINLADVAGPYDRLFKVTHVPEDGDSSNGFARFFGQFDYNTMVNLTYDATYKDAADPYSWYLRVYGAGGVGSRFRAKFYVFSPKRGTLLVTNTAP
jgi:hypothetical protein